MSDAATGRVAAIIPAAGYGVRLGAEKPKAFVKLHRMSLLTRSALAMSTVSDVIVVAAPIELIDEASVHLAEVDAEIHIVAGGDQRQDSISNALKVLPKDIAIVLVHDAARPLVPSEVTNRVISQLRNGANAVIPVLSMSDTIKRVDANNKVVETIDRNQLRRVQTPQGFLRTTIDQAYANPAIVATDDAGLMEALGITVQTVAGDELAMKITTEHDLKIATALLGESNE
jgi:2-C-methyl-D-erythritol 4-phosphate cytidylyltransferase